MNPDYIFILPISFHGEKLVPGHKINLLQLANQLLKMNRTVEFFYFDSDCIYLFNDRLLKTTFTLKDVLKNNALQDSRVIIGPLYLFRRTLFMKKDRVINYFIGDSILKTSIFAFLNNPILIYRAVYGIMIEVLLRKYRIIVVSLEEFTWFSSSGHKIENIFLVTPASPTLLPEKKYLSTLKKRKILIYNPPIDCVPFVVSLINKLICDTVEVEIVVTGEASLSIKKEFLECEGITSFQYLDDISGLILECSLVVLADISGSGFCNRAAQVRKLGIPLLATIPSLRGTGIFFDDKVEILYSPKQGAEFIKSHVNNSSKEVGRATEVHLPRSVKDIQRFDNS